MRHVSLSEPSAVLSSIEAMNKGERWQGVDILLTSLYYPGTSR